MAKTRLCGSCRGAYDGQDDWYPEDAHYEVQGKIPADNNSGWIPYHAFLCSDHVEMYLQDGAVFNRQRKLHA